MMIPCPPTPEWKRPDDLDLNGEAKQDDDDDNGDIEPPNVCVHFSKVSIDHL
jgi:mRNA-capping enzyme